MTGFLYALADLVLAAILAAAWIAVVFLLGA